MRSLLDEGMRRCSKSDKRYGRFLYILPDLQSSFNLTDTLEN